MPDKFNSFSDLSLRQKRRRLSLGRATGDDRTQGDEELPIPGPSTSGTNSQFSVRRRSYSEDSNFSNNEDNREQVVDLQNDDGDNNDNNDDEMYEEEDNKDGDDNEMYDEEDNNDGDDNEMYDGEDIDDDGVDDDDDGDDDGDGDDHRNRTSSSEEENEHIDIPVNPVNMHRRILKNSFLEANLKHSQGNIILRTLREPPFNLAYLPKDVRTLLNTPTEVASRKIQNIAGGEYLHIGFKETIINKLKSLPENMLPEVLEIDISTDGARIHNGAHELWPHQYRIFNISDKRPITAGIFKGQHKPSNPFDFYEQLVQEIREIQEEGGITIGNHLIPLNVRSFITDAPARAFVLNHFGHSSFKACSKCKVVSHRDVPGFPRTTVFEGIRHTLRTDEEYQALLDEDHHKGRSPLSPLLGLVTQVPFEAMHSLYIGNTKKVLKAHVYGNFGFRRLNVRKLDVLDSRMELLKSYCPSEFNRRPNKITMLHAFKATELRQFLLYICPAVLKDIFNEEYYKHFMILHCASRLLVSEETQREMFPFCQGALESYVTLCETLYGRQFLSYNVHSLLHLTSDVETLGSLDSFSAFPFENNMPEMRKCIRKPHLSLQQVYKRLCEKKDYNTAHVDDNKVIRITQPHADGPLVEIFAVDVWRQFHNLELGNNRFATSLRDSCCALEDSRICLIKNIVTSEQDTFFIVQSFRTVLPIYHVGITSDVVGVYRCSNLCDRLEAVNVKEVKYKIYRMPEWSNVEGEEEQIINNKWICVKLLTPIVWT